MTDIIQSFPEYECVVDARGKFIKNMYKGIDVGRGGYVYAEPGMYVDVALIDVSSMHPSSIINMQYFGEYTKNYEDLVKARVAIKHKDFDTLKKLLNGKLEKYIHDESILKTLDKVLKYPINASYGQTAATYPNKFRDERNINNIVALRGALFMVDLKEAVQEQGYSVIHVKTDSIKIPNADDDIVKFVQEFALKYGYSMDYEAKYDRMCLVNDAVYIAKYDEYGVRNKGGEHANEWTATGTEFQNPYIFKTLFTHEPVVFKDYCETKSVNGDTMYLDMNKPMVADLEKRYEELLYSIRTYPAGVPGVMKLRKEAKSILEQIESIHNLAFVGKCGSFVPVDDEAEGGILVRSTKNKDGETVYSAVGGTKGYRWLESEDVKNRGLESHINMDYYRSIVDKAYEHIGKFGDAEWFING